MRAQAAAGSVLIGTGVALNDYVSSPRRRALVYLGLAGAGVSVIALGADEEGNRYIFGDDSRLLADQLRQEIGDLGVTTPGPAADADALAQHGPLSTWLFVAAFLFFLVLSIRVDVAVSRWLSTHLRKRGVGRPYTVVGIIYAALSYAIFELDIRTPRAA